MHLAQYLRANYAQIGDTTGVNKAIDAELRATRAHLFKAAYSSDSYYRPRVKGLSRLRAAAGHVWFVGRHWLWGNGESLWRVGLTLSFAVLVLALVLIYLGTPARVALHAALPLFFGIMLPSMTVPVWLQVTANAARLLLVGLFLSVLIRRMARR
jgi:hypothetical protein